MHKRLGKIKKCWVGIGGYQDAMLGIFFSLEFGSLGCHTEKAWWDPNLIECSERAKWTEEDRSRHHDEVMRYISELLKAAKKQDVCDLAGTPIEAEFEGGGFGSFKKFRILTEVI